MAMIQWKIFSKQMGAINIRITGSDFKRNQYYEMSKKILKILKSCGIEVI